MDIPKAQRIVKSFSVQYFKESGKFYTEGSFDLEVAVLKSGVVYMPEVVHHLKVLRDQKQQLPGLSSSGSEFTIYISHPDGYPCLIFPSN